MEHSLPTTCDLTRQDKSLSGKGGGGLGIFTLPLEIRLRIYEELLVCNFIGPDEFRWSKRVGVRDHGMVFINSGRRWEYASMGLGILRTCKQAYHEAIPILYAKNVLVFRNPDEMLALVTQAGLANIHMIRSLVICVSPYYDVAQWIRLFELLAEEASALRYLRIDWRPTLAAARPIDGFGKNVEFVRALAKIQGLKRLVIEGYYAQNWPVYLEQKMNVPVEVTSPFDRPVAVDFRLTIEDQVENVRQEREREYRRFLEYQEGTEDLWP